MTILTVVCMFLAAAYDHSNCGCFVCFQLLPMTILTVIVLVVLYSAMVEKVLYMQLTGSYR